MQNCGDPADHMIDGPGKAVRRALPKGDTHGKAAAASQKPASDYISGRKSEWYCTVDFDP
jgi:hypothetical protein